MNNYACINPDILAQNCAKQIRLASSGAALSYSTHHASTVQQLQDAASTLKDFNDNDIFAWLKLARSTHHIEPIPEQGSGERHLSPPQVLALSTLKDCPDDRLLGWLQRARLHGHTATSYASQSSIKSGSGAGTAFPCLPVQSESPTAAATVGTKPSAPAFPPIANPWGPHFATDDFPTHNFSRSSNSTRHNNAGNHYWCTVCEEPNSYKDSGNWKKHEKEHETIFVCGLDDAAEKTWAGRSHASKSFTCKRRDIMVNHLNKSHGIIEAHRGRDLADQWRHTMTKQAWSCGFCSSLFYTFQDRLKHVDIEHFRKHQSVNEWDLNKVILGLLQQPKMQRAWKTRAASLPPWVHPENLAWDKATAQGLRAKLEKGPSDDRHAITLADEAYSASKPNEASWHQSGVTLAKRHSEAPAQANSQSFSSPYQVIPALTSDSGLYHRPSSAITGSTAHLISRDASSVDAPTGAFAPSNTIKQSMPALNNEGRADHSSLLSKPSQSWTSASEPGTFFNGYELPESYGGQGAGWPIPNWYDG